MADRSLYLGTYSIKGAADPDTLAEIDRQLPDQLRRRFDSAAFAAFLNLSLAGFRSRLHKGELPAPDDRQANGPCWYYDTMLRYKTSRAYALRTKAPSQLTPRQRQLMCRLIDNDGRLLLLNNASLDKAACYEVFPDGELQTVPRNTFHKLATLRLITYDAPYKSVGDMYKAAFLTERQQRVIRRLNKAPRSRTPRA